ncbi:hypothetical protein RJT34_13003 [Clitoria ternatea]|uniref:Uncharacterized protein n=1 Tax=Clitoria ternatea TaxID=43366 RepID=A0AAN9JN87_CLITE
MLSSSGRRLRRLRKIGRKERKREKKKEKKERKHTDGTSKEKKEKPHKGGSLKEKKHKQRTSHAAVVLKAARGKRSSMDSLQDRATLEQSEKKLQVLKKEFSPKLTKNLEVQLVETKVTDEESFLRSLVETINLELENIKEKEFETRSIVRNMYVRLCKTKFELEAYVVEESKVRDAEKKLQVVVEEAEAAKAAEASALEHITVLTKRTTTTRASIFESGVVIIISKEEFESLSHKVKESDKLEEMKVVVAKAQVEDIKASKNEAFKRLETTQKEIGDIKTAI